MLRVMTSRLAFAELIEDLMRQRRLNASQIAAYAGVSSTMVTNWRRGARPKPESLRLLAEGLRVPYEDLARAAGYLDGIEPRPGRAIADSETGPGFTAIDPEAAIHQ